MADDTVQGGGGTQGGAGAGAGYDWKGALGDQYGAYEPVLQAKGWKGPADALKGYVEMERYAGGAVRIPGETAAPEEWGKFYERLGRPAKAEDYKLPVPEGQDDGFAKRAAGWFHEAGLPAKQAGKLAEQWNAWQAEQDAAFKQQDQANLATLKKEWGGQYDAKAALAQRAMKLASEQEKQRIEWALGSAGALKFFAGFGARLGEDKLIGDGGGGFGASPEAARAELAALQADPQFMTRLMQRGPGHDEAVERFQRLTQQLNPGAVARMG